MKARRGPPPTQQALRGLAIGALLLTAASCSRQLFLGGGDEVSIQRRLDAMPAEGGEVVLDPGVYTIRRPIVLRRDGLALRGSGPATILRLANKANCPVVILGPSENLPRRKVHGLRLSDLSIDGNRKNQQTELWRTQGEGTLIRNNGVTVRAAVDAIVARVNTYNCRSGGLVTEHGTRRLTVTELNAYENEFDGMACYKTEDSVFSHLHLHNNPGAGLSLDLDFDGNVVSDSVLAENDIGIFMRESRYNTFDSLVIRASRNMGVYITHAAEKNGQGEWIMEKDTQCDANTFSGLVVRDCAGAAFRVNEATCSNTLLVAAQFIGNGEGLSTVAPDLVSVRGLIERAADAEAPLPVRPMDILRARRVPGVKQAP